jgi:hypothetical protein
MALPRVSIRMVKPATVAKFSLNDGGLPMRRKQNEYGEVTKALEATLDERQDKGNLTRIATFTIEGLVQFFEEKAKTAPENLPEAPWERNVNSSPKCNCGECDGAGWVNVEGKGVKFCDARSRRSGKSKELGKTESDLDRYNFSAIFEERD